MGLSPWTGPASGMQGFVYQHILPENARRKKPPREGEKVKCVVCGKKMPAERSIMTDYFVFCEECYRRIQAEEE